MFPIHSSFYESNILALFIKGKIRVHSDSFTMRHGLHYNSKLHYLCIIATSCHFTSQTLTANTNRDVPFKVADSNHSWVWFSNAATDEEGLNVEAAAAEPVHFMLTDKSYYP